MTCPPSLGSGASFLMSAERRLSAKCPSVHALITPTHREQPPCSVQPGQGSLPGRFTLGRLIESRAAASAAGSRLQSTYSALTPLSVNSAHLKHLLCDVYSLYAWPPVASEQAQGKALVLSPVYRRRSRDPGRFWRTPRGQVQP